ncbi:MAG: DNA polymerase I [Patescibacteria group bacterium]
MKKLAIIDTFALLHRAWHAIPNLTTKDGRMVNAVYGFTSILLRILKELNPDYVVAAFDLPHETFRKKEYKEYKAQREAPEKDFIDQISLAEDILKALNIPILAKPGYEADDIIGSLAKYFYAKHKDVETIIVSGDLDTLQLVNDRTKIYTMRKGLADTVYYDTAAVRERYDLEPRQIIDMKALAGDPSDNIPGVKGIGVKGAATLIKEFDSLENLYEHLDSPKIKQRTRELLTEQKEGAFMSKRLSTIVTDLHIQLDEKKAQIENYDLSKATKIFQDLEFRSLLSKLPTNGGDATPRAQQTKPSSQHYDVIDNEAGMRSLAKDLESQKLFAIDTETTGLNTLQDTILGASFSWQSKQGVFVHLRDEKSRADFKKHLGPVLENPRIGKTGHNLKFDYQVLKHLGITLAPIAYDTLLAAYLLHPNRSLKLEDLAFSYLRVKIQNLTELSEEQSEEKGSAHQRKKKELDVAAIDPEKLAQYGAADADMALRLYERLRQEIRREGFEKLLQEIEIPLAPILAEMELAGILIDRPFLAKKAKEFGSDIAALEKKIHSLAGVEFNIASPLQMKEILFEKLQIASKGIKRKKTGLSTAAGELDKLVGAHPIIPLILDYREVTKLVNTYVATLPTMVDPGDHRIHTSFNQTVTATGRLSSSDPNLQNIPVRTELGRAIRKAFVAKDGYQLLSADYSQIELRLAAIMSQDPKMLASFKAGEDIHRRTAAEINGVALDEVTPEQRRRAKEVNFGVIYGLGSTGLAQRTGISRQEAKSFIEEYFKLYKGVKNYIESTKSFAHAHGYVETLFGRRRKLPEVYSSSPMLIAQAERMAINMPLQGTAADLLKIAMIRLAARLPNELPDVRMLLQVHDELVFEVPKAELHAAGKLIRHEMEHVADYPIPLVVELKAGQNWAEMTPLDA